MTQAKVTSNLFRLRKWVVSALAKTKAQVTSNLFGRRNKSPIINNRGERLRLRSPLLYYLAPTHATPEVTPCLTN